MKKPQQIYDLEIPYDDYKMAAVMERDMLNLESPYKWFYIGADNRDPCFAKVGIRDLVHTALAIPIITCSARFNVSKAQRKSNSKTLKEVLSSISTLYFATKMARQSAFGTRNHNTCQSVITM